MAQTQRAHEDAQTPPVTAPRLQLIESSRRLREAAERHPAAQLQSSLEFAVRAERMACLDILPRLHAACALEDLQREYDAWTAPLAKFESDELLCLLDLTAAEANEAIEEGRPFHFSAHLSALIMDWTHQTLAETDPASPRAASLRKIFDACWGLFTALAQEADAIQDQP